MASNHRKRRNKMLSHAWNLFASSDDAKQAINLTDFMQGIKWLGLKLTRKETDHIFKEMNVCGSGLLNVKEFKDDVKHDVPVPLKSVVNIRSILLDTLERHLATYAGPRSYLTTLKESQSRKKLGSSVVVGSGASPAVGSLDVEASVLGGGKIIIISVPFLFFVFCFSFFPESREIFVLFPENSRNF